MTAKNILGGFLRKHGVAVFFEKYRVILKSLMCHGEKLLPRWPLEAWVKEVVLSPHCTCVTPAELNKVQVAELIPIPKRFRVSVL